MTSELTGSISRQKGAEVLFYPFLIFDVNPQEGNLFRVANKRMHLSLCLYSFIVFFFGVCRLLYNDSADTIGSRPPTSELKTSSDSKHDVGVLVRLTPTIPG